MPDYYKYLVGLFGFDPDPSLLDKPAETAATPVASAAPAVPATPATPAANYVPTVTTLLLRLTAGAVRA